MYQENGVKNNMKRRFITKDIEKSSELKKKISVLNQIKQQIYIGNEIYLSENIMKLFMMT